MTPLQTLLATAPGGLSAAQALAWGRERVEQARVHSGWVFRILLALGKYEAVSATFRAAIDNLVTFNLGDPVWAAAIATQLSAEVTAGALTEQEKAAILAAGKPAADLADLVTAGTITAVHQAVILAARKRDDETDGLPTRFEAAGLTEPTEHQVAVAMGGA